MKSLSQEMGHQPASISISPVRRPSHQPQRPFHLPPRHGAWKMELANPVDATLDPRFDDDPESSQGFCDHFGQLRVGQTRRKIDPNLGHKRAHDQGPA